MLTLIYITHENKEEAQKVVSHLLEKNLIACANIFPINSFFHWEGEVNSEKEVVSLLKTSKENWEKVKGEVQKVHPYETPCILKMEVQANSDFEEWARKETQ